MGESIGCCFKTNISKVLFNESELVYKITSFLNL